MRYVVGVAGTIPDMWREDSITFALKEEDERFLRVGQFFVEAGDVVNEGFDMWWDVLE